MESYSLMGTEFLSEMIEKVLEIGDVDGYIVYLIIVKYTQEYLKW